MDTCAAPNKQTHPSLQHGAQVIATHAVLIERNAALLLLLLLHGLTSRLLEPGAIALLPSLLARELAAVLRLVHVAQLVVELRRLLLLERRRDYVRARARERLHALNVRAARVSRHQLVRQQLGLGG